MARTSRRRTRSRAKTFLALVIAVVAIAAAVRSGAASSLLDSLAPGALSSLTGAKDQALSLAPLLLLAAAVVAVVAVVARLARTRRRAVIAADVEAMDALSGPDFEKVVADLMRRDGYTRVRIPGGAGDLGADVLATSPSGVKVIVQCKRYATNRKVGSPDIQKFLGTCFTEHGADQAWFATTTAFSAAARELGERRGLVLIDRLALALWLSGQPVVISRSALRRR